MYRCIGFILSLYSQVLSPPDWAHGRLDELKSFLEDRVRDGSFKPLFKEGLDV